VTALGAVENHIYQGRPMKAEAQPVPVVNTMPYARDDRLFAGRPAKGTGYLTYLAGLSSTQRHEFGSTDPDVCISAGFVGRTLCRDCDARQSTAPAILRIPPHGDARHV
jgi:hypothetical protein